MGENLELAWQVSTAPHGEVALAEPARLVNEHGERLANRENGHDDDAKRDDDRADDETEQRGGTLMRLVGEALRSLGDALRLDEAELVDVREQIVDVAFRLIRGVVRRDDAADVDESVGARIANLHRRQLRDDESNGRDLLGGAIGP